MKYLIPILLFITCSFYSFRKGGGTMVQLKRDTVPSGVPQLFGGKYYKFNGYVLVDSFIMNAAGDTNNVPYFPSLKFKSSNNKWYGWDRSSWRAFAYETDPITANNGLTYSSGNIQFGQTISAGGNPAALVHNTEIPLNGFNTVFTGTGTVGIGLNNPSSVTSLDVLSSGINNAIKATSATGVAINATSVSGNGIVGASNTTGFGVQGRSNGGYGIFGSGGINGIGGRLELLQQGGSSDNIMLDLSLLSTGSGIANGAGYTIAMRNTLTSGASNIITGKIKHYLSNATAGGYSSELEFHLANNTTLARKALLSHTGQWTWDGYPSLTAQTDTTTYKPLAIDGSGNVIKMIGWAAVGDTANKWVSDIRRRPGTDTVEKFKNGTWQFAYLDSIKNITVSKGYVSGNSTIADYLTYNGIHRYVMSKADSAVGTTIINNAIPGNTIHQQDSVWLADPNKALYDWIIVEIGLNDLDYTVSFATTVALYQSYINDINTYKKPSAKVIVSTMTPCKQRLLDLYGNTNGLISYQKWLDLNNAIAGGLPSRITGVDYRVTNHTVALNDGSGNLKSVYDIGDHVHETNAARELIGHFWRYALNELGFLRVTQPTYLDQSPLYIVGDTIRAFNTNASLFMGQTINGMTNSPIRINAGGTYGTYGDVRAIKFVTYDPGLNDSTLWAGIGVSDQGQTYHTMEGKKHSFFAGSSPFNPLMTIEKVGSNETKLIFPGAGGFSTTANPSSIDFTGTLANSFGDPTKGKIFLFNNGGLISSITQAYDGVSSQFEFHTYANSSFHHYINSVNKFSITDTSLVAPQLQATVDTSNFKPVVINSSGYMKKMSSWPTGGVLTNFYTPANNTSTTETDLYSYTVAANQLAVDGQKLTFEASGTFNDITATNQIRVYFGATEIFNTGGLTISATGGWSYKTNIIRASSTTAVATTTFTNTFGSSTSIVNVIDLVSQDFTTTNVVKVTGTAGGGGGGSNDITAKMGYIMFLP